MSPAPDAVAIVTGASQGIGEAVVAAFRRAAYAVVGTSRSIPPSTTPHSSLCGATSRSRRPPSA